MLKDKKYKRTLIASYISLSLQAFCVTSVSLLFVALKELYSLTYTELGSLTLAAFIVQVLVDLTVAPQVDKYGFRPFTILSPIFVILGTILFVLAPEILDKPYPLFLVGIIIISMASGFLEVCVSPMVNNLPVHNTSKALSMLHGFYGVGYIFVVVATSILITIFGNVNWQIVMSSFLVLPIIVLILFYKVPIIDNKDVGKKMKYKEFLTNPVFYLYVLGILFGAINELIMAQWSSTYFETALGMPKIAGDLLAVASFALLFTVGRLLYGIIGDKLNLSFVCIFGSFLSFVCYFTLSLTTNIPLSVICCCFCGLGVSMMWPGVLGLSTKYFINASTNFFGTLSCVGDVGCSIGPFAVGLVTDNIFNISFAVDIATKYALSEDQIGLKAGLMLGAISCFACMLVHIAIYFVTKNKQATTANN